MLPIVVMDMPNRFFLPRRLIHAIGMDTIYISTMMPGLLARAPSPSSFGKYSLESQTLDFAACPSFTAMFLTCLFA